MGNLAPILLSLSIMGTGIGVGLTAAYQIRHNASEDMARLSAILKSPALMATYETAFPKRQAIYGLDENGDKTIDHIVHAYMLEWTLLDNIAIDDYHVEDLRYNAFLETLTGN